MPYQFVSADDFLRLAHLFYLFQTETVCFRQKDSLFPAISQISADFHGKVGLFLCPNHLPGEPFPERKMPCVGQRRCCCFCSFALSGRATKNKGTCNKFADLLKLRSDRCRCLLILYDSDRCFCVPLTKQQQQPSAHPRGRCSPTSRPDPRGPCGRMQPACGRWACAGRVRG